MVEPQLLAPGTEGGVNAAGLRKTLGERTQVRAKDIADFESFGGFGLPLRGVDGILKDQEEFILLEVLDVISMVLN